MSETPEIRVFISSTTEDLKEHRAAASNALRGIGAEVVVLENLAANAQSPFDLSRSLIDSCSLFVGIIGWRYGYVPELDNPDRCSFVELEHRYAWEIGKPILVFMTTEDAPWPRRFVDDGEAGNQQKRFRTEVLKRVGVGFFASSSDLTKKLIEALLAWKQREQSTNVPPQSWRSTAPSELPEDVDPFELAWRLVVDRKADPSLLRNMDTDHLREALQAWAREGRSGESAASADLYRTAQAELRRNQLGLAPHPLWLAWIRTTRPSLGPAPTAPSSRG